MSTWLRVRAPLDVLCSVALLATLAPLFVGVALLIVTIDRMCPMVLVERVGRNRKVFGLWKFRTMRPVAGYQSPLTAGRTDLRITALGRVLRAIGVDELPQLGNVIAGRMGIIGPRPEDPTFVDSTSTTWASILSCRPGIMGASQVLLRTWEQELLDTADPTEVYLRTVLPVKICVDDWYVRNASLRLDVCVVLDTITQMAGQQPDRTKRLLRTLAPNVVAAIDDAMGKR